MLVGVTADQVNRQQIFAYSEIFTLDKRGELTRKHIVKEIIPALIYILDKEDLLVRKEDKLPYMDASIFLAHKGVLYEICSRFNVYRYEEFQIIGKEISFGTFYLANTKETDDVNDQIVKALDAIAKYSQLVGSPYILIDTKDLEYKIVRGDS